MVMGHNYLKGLLSIALFASGMAYVATLGSAWAEELSANQIIDSLKVSHTRGLSSAGSRPSLSESELALINRVRSQSRSLSSEDRDQMAAIVTKRPAIDLDINFDYNSAAVSPKSEPQIDNLGKALTSEELAGSVMMLAGHTDAKGGDSYNKRLSERRAETIKRYLVEKYHIPARNLIAIGYGKEGLKNTADPMAAENRRVQVSNVAEREQALR